MAAASLQHGLKIQDPVSSVSLYSQLCVKLKLRNSVSLALCGKKMSIGFGPVEERVTNPKYFDSKMQKNIIARETVFFQLGF